MLSLAVGAHVCAVRKEPTMATTESTTHLVREALGDLRELARLEVELARQDAMTELRRLRTCAIAVGAAAVLAICGLALLLVALALALGHALAALVVGLVCLALGGGCAAFGAKRIPRPPLEPTRRRVEEDVKEFRAIKENAS
jgi:hypothetical protein